MTRLHAYCIVFAYSHFTIHLTVLRIYVNIDLFVTNKLEYSRVIVQYEQQEPR